MKVIPFHEIEGILVGHAQDLRGGTGVSVLLCPEGAVGGVDVRGGAPGTRETDLLNPVNLVEKVHGVFLAGGSAFGLDAGTGIMAYLEEKGFGFDVQVARVPIVCGAVLFDLPFGDPGVRPDREMGYRACCNANNRETLEGNVGAGTGATLGKVFGMNRAMKSGLGAHALQVEELQVGALVAVNPLGNIRDPQTGEFLAGCLEEEGHTILDAEEAMISCWNKKGNPFTGNTTIGMVVTNAAFSKSQTSKLASMAQNGYARTIRPAHTMFDGDTVFALSTGALEADLSVVGLLAARVMEEAVLRAVRETESLGGLPSWKDLR
ncbi:MAG TPA: P1 family peptidase [Synergistaceae bacterium]|nr:P1 family peptidase [Synergistaceae bacterium]